MNWKLKLSYAAVILTVTAFLSQILIYIYQSSLGEKYAVFLTDFFIFLIALAATLAGLALIQQKYDFCGAWKYLTFGLGLWTVGEFIWFFYENVLGILNPFPSIADFFWVAGYIPLTVAIFIYTQNIRAKTVLQNISVSIVGTIVSAVALTAVFGAKIFPQGTGIVEGILAMAYPIADVVLFVLSLHLIALIMKCKDAKKCDKAEIASWAYLAAGFLVLTVADVIMGQSFVSDESLAGHIVNIIYVTTYLFIALSAFKAATAKSVVIKYPHRITLRAGLSVI